MLLPIYYYHHHHHHHHHHYHDKMTEFQLNGVSGGLTGMGLEEPVKVRATTTATTTTVTTTTFTTISTTAITLLIAAAVIATPPLPSPNSHSFVSSLVGIQRQEPSP